MSKRPSRRYPRTASQRPSLTGGRGSLRSTLLARWSAGPKDGEYASLGDVFVPHRLAILMIIAAAIPLLMIFLGTGDAVDMMELFNLIPIREAVRDHHWLMPTLASVPRLEKPPLAVWIPGALSSLLHSDSLWVLRAPSAILAVATAVSTYVIGCIISPGSKNRPYALLSAIILLTMLIFLRNARLANYDIYSTAFLTIGAVGLFGITDGVGKRGWFTLLAGVGLGLSNLSKGPGPLATVVIPFLFYAFIYHRRPAVFLGIGSAILICIAMFLPWPFALASHYPQLDTWGMWFRELRQHTTAVSNNASQTAKDLRDPVWYYAAFLGWVFPHTPALIAGICLPFFTQRLPEIELPTPQERRGRWGVWLIFVIGLVFISCLAEKKPRYALPLFPFAALLCGSVWQDFGRLAADAAKKIDPLGKMILLAQCLCFIAPPAAGLMVLLSPRAAASLGTVAAPTIESLKSLPAPGVILLLMLTLGAGVYTRRLFKQRRFDYALIFVAVSSVALVFTILTLYRGDPENRLNPARRPAESASVIAGRSPVYTLASDRPWLSSIYYLNRPVHSEAMPDLVAAATQFPDEPFYFMLVTGSDKKDNPETLQKLNAFELESHRHPDLITSWFDETRHTIFYRMITPLETQPAPATSPTK